jgi:type VI protein secretion system component VasF
MALPWKKLSPLTPVAVALARALFDLKPKPAPQGSKDLQARLAALEDVQRRQADATQALAEQTAALAEAADALRRRTRTLMAVAVLGAVLALAALVVAVLR